MQYVVIAYDYTDNEALNRRLANREAHLAGISEMIKQGTFLSGGALLDDHGKMIGSSVHVNFADREQLQQWLDNDPYVVGNVWEKIQVNEAKFVTLS
ncbi:YciI family protein [Thalassotalea ganghwensis]